jgi:hypothetical protein
MQVGHERDGLDAVTGVRVANPHLPRPGNRVDPESYGLHLQRTTATWQRADPFVLVGVMAQPSYFSGVCPKGGESRCRVQGLRRG